MKLQSNQLCEKKYKVWNKGIKVTELGITFMQLLQTGHFASLTYIIFFLRSASIFISNHFDMLPD